jgi:hypothetical protein
LQIFKYLWKYHRIPEFSRGTPGAHKPDRGGSEQPLEEQMKLVQASIHFVALTTWNLGVTLADR